MRAADQAHSAEGCADSPKAREGQPRGNPYECVGAVANVRDEGMPPLVLCESHGQKWRDMVAFAGAMSDPNKNMKYTAQHPMR